MADKEDKTQTAEEIAEEKEREDEYEANVGRLLKNSSSDAVLADPRMRKLVETDILDDGDEDMDFHIHYLLGNPAEWSPSTEAQHFREAMRLVKEESKRRLLEKQKTQQQNGETEEPQEKKNEVEYVYPPVILSTEPLPQDTPTNFVAMIHLPNQEMSKKYMLNGGNTVPQQLASIVERLNKKHNTDKKPEDFVLKVTGIAEYLYGENTRLLDFEYIRNCLKKNIEMHLNIIEKSSIATVKKSQAIDDTLYDISLNAIYTHEQTSLEYNYFSQISHLSIWDIHRPLSVTVLGLDNLWLLTQSKAFLKTFLKAFPNASNPEILYTEFSVYVVAEVYHAGKAIAKPKATNLTIARPGVKWNQKLDFPDLLVSTMPKATRISFTAYARPYKKDEDQVAVSENNKDFPIGWANFQLIDHKDELKTGKFRMGLWPDEKANPIGTNIGNIMGSDMDLLSLCFTLDEYAYPVVFPSGKPPFKLVNQTRGVGEGSIAGEIAKLDQIIRADPLDKIAEEDQELVWKYREKLTNNPQALPKFLRSVKWKNPAAVYEAHRLLDQWETPSPLDALQLLDSHFADEKVRTFAVRCLDVFSDNELSDFILQLGQCLKYESYHDSPLARFLLKRAANCTYLIGHQFFWLLKAEMHLKQICERYGLILEEYLRTCGQHRKSLVIQNIVIDQLLGVALKIKEYKKAGCPNLALALREELAKLKLPQKFKLPLSDRLEANGLILEKCKVMSSKKLPLWLVFQNADKSGAPIYIMFKAGDDLRQDLLTLQMLRIMDNMWKATGLDLHLIPYGCVATGDGVGMIEIVLNSDTVANISVAGGGALKLEPLKDYLISHNTEKEKMEKAVQNFVYSSAGYCVATYVLGIGDRHNDNIMLTKDGNLFHIDFGHFLGHFKSKFGIKRETAPFVFQPMYAFVMGGENSPDFKKFVTLACQAYNELRKHTNLFITLFQLMLSTGIPELTSEEDIMWLRKCLLVGKSDVEAAEHYTDLVFKALGNLRGRLNDVIHIWAHKNSKQ